MACGFLGTCSQISSSSLWFSEMVIKCELLMDYFICSAHSVDDY